MVPFDNIVENNISFQQLFPLTGLRNNLHKDIILSQFRYGQQLRRFGSTSSHNGVKSVKWLSLNVPELKINFFPWHAHNSTRFALQACQQPCLT